MIWVFVGIIAYMALCWWIYYLHFSRQIFVGELGLFALFITPGFLLIGWIEEKWHDYIQKR